MSVHTYTRTMEPHTEEVTMMPNVNIANPVFNRLQSKAVPLVDDLDSVLIRLLDFWDKNHSTEDAPVAPPEDLTVKTYPGDAPPDLTYTSIKSVKIGGVGFPNRYWNPVMFHVIAMVGEGVGKDVVKSLLEGNFSEKETKGYQHVLA